MTQQTLNHLVELYEYKVMDVLSKREPRGGKTSVRELRELLTNSGLNGTLLRRFRESDRKLREQSVVQHVNMHVIEEKRLGDQHWFRSQRIIVTRHGQLAGIHSSRSRSRFQRPTG